MGEASSFLPFFILAEDVLKDSQRGSCRHCLRRRRGSAARQGIEDGPRSAALAMAPIRILHCSPGEPWTACRETPKIAPWGSRWRNLGGDGVSSPAFEEARTLVIEMGAISENYRLFYPVCGGTTISPT